ncbi:hypothetical protein ACYSMR_06045 [Kocuria sp. U4B]
MCWFSPLLARYRAEGTDASSTGAETIAWRLYHHHGYQISHTTISGCRTRAGLTRPAPKTAARTHH